MADILTAVKSVRNQKDNEPAESLLTAIKSTDARSKDTILRTEQDDASSTQRIVRKDAKEVRILRNTPEEALDILRSQPSLNQVVATLKQLRNNEFPGHFNIHAPGPLQAQIINTLLSTTVPDFWPVLRKTHSQDLVSCLTNVASFNAIFAKLKSLATKNDSTDRSISSAVQAIGDLLDVAEHLLIGDQALSNAWKNLRTSVPFRVKRQMSWKEVVNLTGSGKIVATVAQAEDKAKSSKTRERSDKGSWLASGPGYATWLGRNIAGMLSDADPSVDPSPEQSEPAAAQVLAKGLNLGYSAHLLGGLFKAHLPDMVTRQDQSNGLKALLGDLPTHDQRSFVEHFLRWLSGFVPSESTSSVPDIKGQTKDVSAVASLLSFISRSNTVLHQHLTSFLTDPALSSSLSLPVRRACVTTLSSIDGDDLEAVVEKLMTTFSDQLFIKHAPILQQETLAQTLLLTAGYIHRKSPMALLVTARSSSHMQGVSNRLDSPNPRARWLGMVVGTALSSLVDKEGSQMSFGTDEMQTEEAKWYLELVNVEDKIGTLQDFQALLQSMDKMIKLSKQPTRQTKPDQMPKLNGKRVFGPPRPPVQTEVIGEKVTELLDDESDEDDDLKPFAKPDSDPEDSDEDATLVNRNKARAPVYIRDLMAMLRDDKSHDRFQLGISHAASLIRRKANFGAEVKDHAEELAGVLCNLQDPFETEDFDEMRLQAMIAVLLSDFKAMGPWFSKQAFIGEYSISQRCVILSALGLGGRQLAGFKNEDELNPTPSNTDFPSKRLPPRLHAIYGSENTSTKHLQAASADIEHQLIKPMALQAADQSTADLNAVKVRTFSSRMDVERTKRKPAPNQLAKIFGESLFFPLANRYQQEFAAYGTSSVYASAPFVLVTFLKTLALLLHASGPATFDLPQISADFWDLLLSLRVQAIQDISVLQAVLFSLLTLLEMNTDKRRIAEEHPKQLMETQQWVDLIFERMGGGGLVSESGNEDEAKVRTLAAGVLMKTREVIGAYQKLLIGYSFD